MANDVVQLDGSIGEGGGQILRTALALALITGRPFRLRHIRARRSKPGLQPQHLMSVQAAARIGAAQLKGATLGSTSLDFEPGAVAAGDYHFRIGTAGAASLVLHTVYLPLALAKTPSRLTIEGGTHVPHSPCFHFLERTWRGYMSLLGLNVDVRMERPGFYPRGGGVIHADIQPAAPRPLTIAALPPVSRARVHSAAARLPAHVIERQARRAADWLKHRALDVDIVEEAWRGGPGTMLGIELATAPVPTFFFGLGERGKPAEQVADEAVDQVEAFLDGGPVGVDEHSADQLLLPLALAEGESSFPTARVSMHLLTNAAVIQQFVPRRLECAGEEGDVGMVRATWRR